mmetsp:Transcript_4085/g.4218  ORF Transcript_4085/g.4218 Transcript_4085/m.4218 type:complete len:617 (-) Transcript_4085:838-2688(-)
MNQQDSMIEVREVENDNTDDGNKDSIRANSDHTTNIVDRKIHHIQSNLIEKSSETSFEQSFIEAKLWFQPRHYVEVIDERSNEGMCGSPTCCNSISKPQDLAASLKISYKEKRLYEVGRSKLFCCNACFKDSAMFEATLVDTHPGSRQVAIDFISKFGNGVENRSSNLLPSINGAETDDRISEVDILPPKFQNALLDAAGAAKVPLKSVHFKEVIPPTVDAAKRVNKDSFIDVSHASDTSSLLSSSSSLPIFNYKKELPPITEVKRADITELNKTVGEEKVINSNQKKVSFSSSKSLEFSVEEKWTDIVPPVKSSSSGKNSSRPQSNYLTSDIYSNLPPTKMDEGEVGNHIFLKLDEDGSIYEASSVGGVDDMIEETDPSLLENETEDMESFAVEDELSLFMLLWTALDDLFGHCEPILSSPLSSENDANELLFSPTIQQLYTTVKGKLNPTPSTDTEITIKDESIDAPIIRQSIDTTMLASHRSVAMFVERGFATAEKVSELSTYLNPITTVEYDLIKSMILATADLQHTICPPLKSSEFALLALLVIDAIVSTRKLIFVSIEQPPPPNKWELNIETIAGNLLRIRRGRQAQQPNTRQLRDGDLKLLRSFFSRSI